MMQCCRGAKAHHWQAVYMSPNEGGSGSATPLFADFCLVMLGWEALGQLAAGPPSGATSTLQHTVIYPESGGADGSGGTAAAAAPATAKVEAQPLNDVLDWVSRIIQCNNHATEQSGSRSTKQ